MAFSQLLADLQQPRICLLEDLKGQKDQYLAVQGAVHLLITISQIEQIIIKNQRGGGFDSNYLPSSRRS